MADASLAVNLLLTDNNLDAKKYAARLDALNEERKAMTSELQAAAHPQAHAQIAGEHNGVLVLSGERWHAGILGSTANRIVEKFLRPTIMLSVVGNTAKGSARTFGSVNLYDALTECADLLESFGGHAGAAGLQLHVDNILPLRQRLSRFAKKRLSKEDFEPKIHYDAVLSLSEISGQFENIVLHLEPCGKANEAPVFLSHDLVARSVKRLKNEHLKFTARQADERNGTAYEVIAFNQSQQYQDISGGKPFDMLFTIEQNHYKGRTTTQLNAQAIRAPHRAEQ